MDSFLQGIKSGGSIQSSSEVLNLKKNSLKSEIRSIGNLSRYLQSSVLVSFHFCIFSLDESQSLPSHARKTDWDNSRLSDWGISVQNIIDSSGLNFYSATEFKEAAEKVQQVLISIWFYFIHFSNLVSEEGRWLKIKFFSRLFHFFSQFTNFFIKLLGAWWYLKINNIIIYNIIFRL